MEDKEIISCEENMRCWIDNASYVALLDRWRNEPVGSQWFKGSIGKYYARAMRQRRIADPNEAVRASKTIGWK